MAVWRQSNEEFCGVALDCDGIRRRSVLGRLERDVAVLARRARLSLRDRGAQRLDADGARAPRLDDVVHVAALGRGVGIREALLVVRDQLRAAPVGILRLRELAWKDDVD